MRSLSLPRKATSAMRESLRSNPTKALNYQVFREQLTNLMIQSYTLGYRSKGASLKQDTRRAKREEYSTRAYKILREYQKSANAELKRTHAKAISDGKTPNQARQAVLRRFRTLGMTAPAYNQIETLFRTASNAAYNQGVWDATRQDASIWGYRWRTARDERVRHPEHSQFEGMTLPRTDPIWDEFWPPICWNCRCRIISLKRKQKEKRPRSIKRPVCDEGFQGQRFELR